MDSHRKRTGAVVEDEDPYRVLGIGRDSDDAAVEKAFREKIHLYHPDKFANNPEWVREKAKEETVKLNRAYEALKGLNSR
jgi:curved DNA-binding protein CbpA